MASESCSSTNNGCFTCAPGLVLFQLSASNSKGIFGLKQCDSKYYWSECRAFQGSDYYSPVPCLEGGGTATWGNNLNIHITPYIDKYGDIYFLAEGSSNCYSSGSDGDNVENPSDSCGSASVTKINKNSCPPVSVTTFTGTECNDPSINPCDEYNPCTSEHCNGSSSCERETGNCSCGSSDPCPICRGPEPYNNPPECIEGSMGQSTFEGSWGFNHAYADPKQLKDIYALVQSSVSTKIKIYENNQPHNCAEAICGDGGKDDCWGGAGSFQIADNNLDDPAATSTTAQKLKFKIGTRKEEFNKEYKSVSGKIKFYIQSEKDAEEGRTPCCNDDFSGTVVKEQDYSISAGETFKNDYFASDAGDFDNNDQSQVGKTINICYTIKNVSFI